MHVHRLEAVTGAVELAAHVIGKLEPAVEPVGPGVIGADQIADIGVRGLHQARAAMTADIVKGMDLVIVVAHNQHRVLPISTVMTSPACGISASTPT